MNLFTAKWPFYISGPLLALLCIVPLYIFDAPAGLGKAMETAGEYFSHAAENGTVSDLPGLNWELGLLGGIFAGALLTAAMTGAFKPELMSSASGSFTADALHTAGCGIAGGVLIMLGIQLSGDTVFGHMASAMQLSGGAWLFLTVMVISGCTLALLWERRGDGGKNRGKSRNAGKGGAK